MKAAVSQVLIAGFLACSSQIPIIPQAGPWVLENYPSLEIYFSSSQMQRPRPVFGKGSFQGEVTAIEAQRDAKRLLWKVQEKAGTYTVILPGWQKRTAPFERGDWVVVEYLFSDSKEYLRVFGQGKGLLAFFYEGREELSRQVDRTFLCQPAEMDYWTAEINALQSEEEYRHFLVRCLFKGKEVLLRPGQSRRFMEGKRVYTLRILRAREKGSDKNVRLAYLWSVTLLEEGNGR